MAETITVLSAAPVALPLTLPDGGGGTSTLVLAAAQGGVPSRTTGVEAAFYRAWIAANGEHPAVANRLLAEVEDDEIRSAADDGDAAAFETLTARLTHLEDAEAQGVARIGALEANAAEFETTLAARIAERDAARGEVETLKAEVARLTEALGKAEADLEAATAPKIEPGADADSKTSGVKKAVAK